MPYRFRIICLFLLLQVTLADAKPASGHIHYNVKSWPAGDQLEDDKLPEGTVISMTQTHDGYLWLGTLGGLVRFDGVRFTIFNQIKTPGLNDDQIVHLFEDSTGALWVGTKNEGVVVIQNGVLQNVDFGAGSRKRIEHLSAACEDELGAVWLYTSEGRLLRHYQGHNSIWLVGAETKSNCRALAAEKGGLLWLGTDTMLYAIDPHGDFSGDRLPLKLSLPVPAGLNFLLAGRESGLWVIGGGLVEKWKLGRTQGKAGITPWTKPVFSACEDTDGNLVVGTLGDGIYWFQGGDSVSHITSREDGLTHDYILSLVIDREGSLWAGTDGKGLDHIKRQPFSVLPGTEATTVQSVCADARGGLWINSHGGLSHFQDNELTGFPCVAGDLVNNNGQSVLVDHSGTVWAGCAGSTQGLNLFQLHSNRFDVVTGYARQNNLDVSALFEDHSGNIWVGSSSGLSRWDGTRWTQFSESDGLTSDNVQAIAEDVSGQLYIGTAFGLTCLKSNVFKAIHTRDGLPGENISALLVDSDGVLWASTHGKGLGRMKDGKWTHYTSSDGLLSDSLGYLLEDSTGGLWIGSLSGLMHTRKEELNRIALNNPTNHAYGQISCHAYDEASGLPSSECTFGSQPAACRSSDGRLWFPTSLGLATVNPVNIHVNNHAPPVVIETVMVADELQETNALLNQSHRELVIPPGKEGLEIHYTSLNLASASKTRFKYWMEGYEARPGHSVKTRVANYSKLPSGHYVFHVTAGNEDDVWNETPATLFIFVQPPFWRTWWFITWSSLILAAITLAIVHYLYTQRMEKHLEGMRRQQALENERSRIARDIHDQLGASMTQISLLSEMVESDKGDPAEVENHARLITQTARDTSRVLDEIVWTVNPSNDTLEGLINYICKYAQEYFAIAEIRYRLDIPAQLPEASITPEVRHNVFLCAKEAITNVVKHARATEVRLGLKILPGEFILELQDNGKGPVNLEGKESRNGLRNMSKRMEDVGGSFSLSAAPEGGALAKLTVPIKK